MDTAARTIRLPAALKGELPATRARFADVLMQLAERDRARKEREYLASAESRCVSAAGASRWVR